MKKFLTLIMAALISSQTFAAGWHGGPQGHGYNYGRPSYHSGPVINNYNYGSRGGEWRRTNHNGQLAWWFVVGSMFYLSEQAYLNDMNRSTVVVTPQPVYPAYSSTYVAPAPVYQTYPQPVYRVSNGWYCEVTGRFSTGQYDTCPTPWISRQY